MIFLTLERIGGWDKSVRILFEGKQKDANDFPKPHCTVSVLCSCKMNLHIPLRNIDNIDSNAFAGNLMLSFVPHLAGPEYIFIWGMVDTEFHDSIAV